LGTSGEYEVSDKHRGKKSRSQDDVLKVESSDAHVVSGGPKSISNDVGAKRGRGAEAVRPQNRGEA
jgi:hypothetical protein